MRKYVLFCAAWLCFGMGMPAPAAGLDGAEFDDPKPGSQAALNTLVKNYRRTIVELLKFEAENEHVLEPGAYANQKFQVVETVLVGLDNIDNAAANQLVADLSAVYFGAASGSLYIHLAWRKGKKLKKYLESGQPLRNWCTKNLPVRYCLSEEIAAGRIRSGLESSNNTDAGLTYYH